MTKTAKPSPAREEVAATCPFGHDARSRAVGPVFRDEDSGFWVVTRYEDVRAVANDWEDYASVGHDHLATRSGVTRPDEVLRYFVEQGYAPTEALVAVDPPRHRRHRAAISAPLSRARSRAMEPVVTRFVDALLDDLVDRGGVEFCADFADRLPLMLITHCLGLPQTEIDRVGSWAAAVVVAAEVGRPVDEQLAAARTLVEMQHWAVEAFAAPRATADESLIGSIAAATAEDGLPLPMEQRLMIVLQTLVAGIDTTSSALASAVWRVARDADLQERLRREAEWIPAFVDESLRLDAPVQGVLRRATRDLARDGCAIRRDDILLLRWGDANRDAARFERPDEFDLGRDGAHQHVSFGHGVHFCPGKDLARVAVAVTLRRLLERTRTFAVATAADAIDGVENASSYSLTRLRLELGAA